jgi:hypothetical protein
LCDIDMYGILICNTMGKQKWQGKKHAGSHTTLIGAAELIVRAAEKMQEVKKISPGYITATPGILGKRGVKCVFMTGGLKVTVRGNAAVQEIRIYTDVPQKVQQALEQIQL